MSAAVQSTARSAIRSPERRIVLRRDAGLYGYERALERAGLSPVAGVDEAGRGACAGPLVAAAVVLPGGRRGEVPGLADSKLLTAAARERCYDEIVRRAVAWSVVIVPAADCDRLGMHVANVEALRRALFQLETQPAYVLSDGFPVDGLGVPGLAVWKGDRVVGCIAAASVIAKVTRDRLMAELHERFPAYDFATHKGYCTAEHQSALEQHGPCPEHRRRWVNVRAVMPGTAEWVGGMGDNESAGRSARPIEAMVLDEPPELGEPDDLDEPNELLDDRDETAGTADEFVADAVDETGEVRR